MKPILIITNFPDKKGALNFASVLIDERLAACVNVLGTGTSVYRWQGKTEFADEVPVLIKTQQEHYSQIEKRLKMIHPFELPELIFVPVNGGLPAYLSWIEEETAPINKIP